MERLTQGRPARAMVLVTLGGLGLWGCSGGEEAPSAPPPTPLAEAPAAPGVPPEPERVSATMHAAMFDDDQTLLTCVSFTVSVEAGNEPDGGVESLASRMTQDREDLLKLARPCEQQFSDRVQWALCSATIERNGRRVEFVERYYDFGRAFDSDRHMRDCLEMGGDWNAASRDTPEWRRAAAAHRVDEFADETRRSQEDLRRALRR